VDCIADTRQRTKGKIRSLKAAVAQVMIEFEHQLNQALRDARLRGICS
jgi:hypothetical protein